MIRTAQDEPGIPVKPEAFDADPWLLNCTNGTLDLHTETLDLHTGSASCGGLWVEVKARTAQTWARGNWRIDRGPTPAHAR